MAGAPGGAGIKMALGSRPRGYAGRPSPRPTVVTRGGHGRFWDPKTLWLRGAATRVWGHYGVFAAFDASRSIEVDPLGIKWLVLPKMLETAEQLHKHVQEVKAGGGPPKAAATRPAASFRQRQPW